MDCCHYEEGCEASELLTMDAFIQLPEDQRRLYCGQAQAYLGLPPASIEKDFWVCWTLRELVNLPIWGSHLTFKGGTSLSKAWKLIERFSEDIDIVVDRAFLGFGGDTLSSKKQKRLRKVCSDQIQAELKPALENQFGKILPTSLQWRINLADVLEDPDQQTLVFNYPSVFTSSAVYLNPIVKIELGARSETEPAESPNIQAYLAETFPELLGPSTFKIRTVAARRTFWEKAMLLHEETYRPPDKRRKARLARHYYDLWCLIEKGVAKKAVEDLGLFERVAEHRAIFFGQRWMDYSTLCSGQLRLVPPENQFADWKRDYQAMQNEMIFGKVPNFEEIIEVVDKFEKWFNQVKSIS
jgi:hypothetical protein